MLPILHFAVFSKTPAINARFPIIMMGALLLILRSTSAEVELTAREPLVFDTQTREMTAQGDARLRHEESLLTANQIVYSRLRGEAEATGRVVISSPAMRATADRVHYDIEQNILSADAARFGSPPFFGFTERFTYSDNRVHTGPATLYFAEPNPFSLNLRAASATYIPNEHLSARHVTLRVGHIPFFYLPVVARRVDGMATEITYDLGHSDHLGSYLMLDTNTPVLPWLSPGVNAGFFSQRGVMFGPALRYQHTGPDHFIAGRFNSGYIRDTGNPDIDRIDQPIDPSRHYIDWRHKQRWNDRVEFTGVANLWSDSEVARDFRPRLFHENHYPDNFLEGVYLGDGYIVSAFTRVSPNDFMPAQERLPDLRFDLMPRELGQDTDVYQRLQIGGAMLREDRPADMGDEPRSNRAFAYYNLSRPIPATDWLTITPTAGVHLTHYDRAIGDRDNYTRALGEIGFDAVLSAYALYDYQNPLWRIDGIRHVVKPKIQYRYVPKADRGRPFIPLVDRQVFTTNLPPLGLGEIRHIDELDEIHTLRIGVENLVQTRRHGYGSHNLLTLFVANDIRFARRPGEEVLSDVHAELIFTPIHWLTFDAFSRVSPHELDITQLSTGLTLIDGRVWSTRLGAEFLEGSIEQYTLSYRLRLTDSWSTEADWRYDARQHRFDRQAYSLIQDVHNTWRIEYSVVLRDGAKREPAASFTLSVSYLAF